VISPEKIATLTALHKARNAFHFVLGGYALMTTEPSASELAKYAVSIGNGHLVVSGKGEGPPLGGTGYRIEFRAALQQGEATDVVERAFRYMLQTTYDIVAERIGARSIQAARTRHAWLRFAWRYRSAIAHGSTWKLDNAAGLPVTWRHLTIDASMNGQPVDGFMGWYDGLQLCAETINFVEQH